MDDLLFFDIEVFFRNAFVVFKDATKKTVRVFHNDFTGLEDFVKGKTLVSFNGHWYDDHILHAMMDLKTPEQLKALNDRIIGGERMRIKNYKYRSLDVFQQIDPSSPGLKKIEANFGKKILESSVSFEIERELTEDEYQESLAYCEYDTEMVIEIYKLREKNYFKPKSELVKMLDNPNAENWNTTTISANLLMKKPLPKWATIRVPDHLLDLVPADVVELWETKSKGNITIREMDNEIVFGFGGLHGANTRKKRFENVINLDVASLYPSIIVNHNILGPATAKYKEILEERIRIKHTEPDRQQGLKLVLNSVYGLLNSEYSLLYNPKASITVCAIGQCVLYDLAKRLSGFAEIVQINTDGVAFIPYDNHSWKAISEEWQKEHNYVLEREDFKLFIQRDVNNYIAVQHDGYMKNKGSDVGRYYQPALFKNNNTRIIDKCIVDKLVHGKEVLDTLLDHLDQPELFQYVLIAGRTFQGTFNQDDEKMDRINRVFAAKKEGLTLYKKRQDGGLVKFPDAPHNMFIWNDDCSKLENFDQIVDLNHYYTLIHRKLNNWM